MNLCKNGRSQRSRVGMGAHGKIHRVPVAKGVFFEERARQLAVRPINVRSQRNVERPLADVADDAHDRLPRGIHPPAYAFPDSVLSWPELPGHGQTHDGYRLRFEAVLRREPPALLKRNAHRFNIASQHPRLANSLWGLALRFGAPFDSDRNHLAGMERQIVRDPGSLNTRQV